MSVVTHMYARRNVEELRHPLLKSMSRYDPESRSDPVAGSITRAWDKVQMEVTNGWHIKHENSQSILAIIFFSVWLLRRGRLRRLGRAESGHVPGQDEGFQGAVVVLRAGHGGRQV